MATKVTNIKTRLHSSKFATSYPKYLREDTMLREIDPSNEEVMKYVVPAQDCIFCAVTEEPKAGYVKATEIDLDEILVNFNQLLLYRLFRNLYGEPDVLSAYVLTTTQAILPVDWSFSFSIQPNLIGEVRNKFMSRVYLNFWIPKLQSVASRKKLGEAMAKCLTDFNESVEKNLHLWDEKDELRNPTKLTAFVNVPAEKYKGAEELLWAAQNSDHAPVRKPLEWSESSQPLRPTGYLYTSAATMFFISFESFVNLLYRLLLRPEFKGGTYERVFERSDIDLRLVSMHIYCSGFASQAIQPGSDLWERLIQLRNFRNDVVHGNITAEHESHIFREDGFTFYYMSAGDFQGRGRKPASPSLTRLQPKINKKTVTTVKQTVDDLRESILAAMDDKTREWVNSWLWQTVVPHFGPKQGSRSSG